jgi:hypothetical protein
MHACGYVHTDIRWSNIVLMDNNDWMLIDCYDACMLSDKRSLLQRAEGKGLMSGSWSERKDLAQLAGLGTDSPTALVHVQRNNCNLQ